MLDDLDLIYNPEPICPYCGDVYTDAWELNIGQDDSTTITCGACDEEYEVTYTTRVLKND